jgi:hypothetical protein
MYRHSEMPKVSEVKCILGDLKAIYALCMLVIHSINNPFLETVVTSETQEPSNLML